MEIKGCEPTAEELTKLSELAIGTGHISYLLCGSPDQVRVWIANLRGEVKEWVDVPHLYWLAFITHCPKNPATVMSTDAAISAALSARFEHGENGAS